MRHPMRRSKFIVAAVTGVAAVGSATQKIMMPETSSLNICNYYTILYDIGAALSCGRYLICVKLEIYWHS